MEQTNARTLDPRNIVRPADASRRSTSPSFSLEKNPARVFGVLAAARGGGGPREAAVRVGREHVGKGGGRARPGNCTAPRVQRLARYSVLRGWHVLACTASPLRGPKETAEFFLHCSSHGRTASDLESRSTRSVEGALREAASASWVSRAASEARAS